MGELVMGTLKDVTIWHEEVIELVGLSAFPVRGYHGRDFQTGVMSNASV